MIISICGKSGSGKSLITNLLSTYNKKIVYLNIDIIGHETLKDKTAKNQLINYFGEKILTNDEIDRSKLGNLVFTSKDNMNKLVEITWPIMEKAIDEFIKNNKNKIIILDYFILPLTKYFEKSDLKILIESSFEDRLNRIKKRDNIDVDKFLQRERNSLDYSNYRFDYIIKNDDETETEKEIRRIYDKSIISR